MVSLQVNRYTGSCIPFIKTNLLYILFISLCLLSCNKKQNFPHFLSVADTLVYSHPDSAVSLLKRNELIIKDEPKSIQMYYRLLVIKADDKAYIPHTVSTEKDILEIVDYYNKRDKQILPEALYYAGRVYDDLQDSPQALEYYYKAIDASKSTTDKGLLGRIYTQIGTIYQLQDLSERAITSFSKALQYYTQDKDSIAILYTFRDLGSTYTTLEKKTLAISYYQKAITLGAKLKRPDLEGMVLRELGGYYTDCGEYSLAYSAIQRGRNAISKDGLRSLYSVLSRYYLHTNQLDSASIYVTKLLQSNSQDKKIAYNTFALIAQKRGQYRQSMAYFQKSLSYADSVINDNDQEACAKAAALYNYQLKNKENTELQLKTKNQEFKITLLIISLVVFIILFLVYRKYYKMRSVLEKKKLMKLKDEQYRQSQTYIQENEKNIKSLEIELQRAFMEKDELKAKLVLAQKNAYEKCNAKIIADKALQKEAMFALKKTIIYKKFNEATTRDILHEDDWQTLYEQIRHINPDFIEHLHELCPNDMDFKMSVLIKLGITPFQISIDINRSKQWVTNKRKALAQRLFDNMYAKPVDWDNFIRDL